jgi:hypothetical protein
MGNVAPSDVMDAVREIGFPVTEEKLQEDS